MYFFIKKYNDVKKPYKVAELEYLYVVVVYHILEFHLVSIIGLYSQTCYLLFKACTTRRGTSTRRGEVL